MVELVRAGRGPDGLAKEFEPSGHSIREWVRRADQDDGVREDGLSNGEHEELKRLRREVRQLRQERDAALLERIRWIHTVSQGTYGAPRIHAELAAEGPLWAASAWPD